MKLIRAGYIIYFLLLLAFLKANHFIVGDLNSYFFWYFVELFLVLELASTAGVFNEIIELVLDYTTGSQRLGPGWDTAIDLLMNTLGILIIMVFVKKDEA